MRDLAEIVVMSHDERARDLRHGRLLEVGYGLGLSAKAIQSLGVKTHVVIEANVQVMRRLMTSSAGDGSPAFGALRGVQPILGFWQEVVPMLGDGALCV